MNLSDNIKQIRKEHNLSQEALAEKLGVSRQSVSKWESGQAYPEMDKVLQICNMFNISIDELMHEDIKTVKEAKESKNNSKKLVDDFLNFINKTIDLFTSLSFKGKIKCLFEQILIIFIFAMLALIIVNVLGSIIKSMLSFAPWNALYAIMNFIYSIFVLISIIVIFLIWVHLFKKRYLDYYEIIHTEEKDSESPNVSKDEDEKEEPKPIIEIRKEPKIIIRDEKSSSYSFFSFLTKIILFFVKLFLFFFALGIAFILMSLGIMLALCFLFKIKSFFFIGSFISVISASIICFIFLKMIYDFMFNRQSRKGLMGIILGICILTGGLGIGLFAIDALKIDYYDVNPKEKSKVDTFNIKMDDNLLLDFDHYTWNSIEFISTDNNDVIIEYTHPEYTTLTSSKYNLNEEDKTYLTYNIYTYGDEAYTFKYIRSVIKDINDYKIYNPYINTIKIYTTEENIQTLKNNYQDYHYGFNYYEN